jgi:UDP-glucose 4-epimerase
LISELLKFKKFRILSVDNYSSGLTKNHINNKRVKYLKGSSKNIEILLKSYIGKIHSIFHFGEFS